MDDTAKRKDAERKSQEGSHATYLFYSRPGLGKNGYKKKRREERKEKRSSGQENAVQDRTTQHRTA